MSGNSGGAQPSANAQGKEQPRLMQRSEATGKSSEAPGSVLSNHPAIPCGLEHNFTVPNTSSRKNNICGPFSAIARDLFATRVIHTHGHTSNLERVVSAVNDTFGSRDPAF